MTNSKQQFHGVLYNHICKEKANYSFSTIAINWNQPISFSIQNFYKTYLNLIATFFPLHIFLDSLLQETRQDISFFQLHNNKHEHITTSVSHPIKLHIN